MKRRSKLKPSASSNALERYYTEGHASWDIGKPQPSIAELTNRTNFADPVLEVGCGTGEHCFLLASKGHRVTGIDISATAIATAEKKKNRKKLPVTFVQTDVLEWSSNEPFGTVLDVGFFHCLGDSDAARYLSFLSKNLRIGGHLYMLCLQESPHDSNQWPYAYEPEELEQIFSSGWQIHSISNVLDHNTFGPEGLPANLMIAMHTG